MKYLKINALVLLFIMHLCNLHAQDIITDNTGGIIFSMPTALVAPKISANTIGLSFPIYTGTPTKYWYYNADKAKLSDFHPAQIDNSIPDDFKIFTMVKSFVVFSNFSIISNTASILDFSQKTNISPHVEIGVSGTLDSILNPSLKSGFYYTYAISAFADYQNFNEYDPIVKTLPPGKFRKISPGVRAIVDFFHKNAYAIALSGSYQYGADPTTLTSYQNLTNTFYSDESVATNGKTDGYISPVNQHSNFRFSIAIPLFVIKPLEIGSDSKTKSWIKRSLYNLRFTQFAPTPYYFVTTEEFNGVAHNAGITINLLPSKIYHSTNYSITSAISLGYNIINSAAKDNPRFVFLSGSFSFGDLKAPENSNKPGSK